MLVYNDDTLFGINEKGEAIVFDWARECGFYPRIRVEAIRSYVEHNWKLNWNDRKAIKDKFDIEKHTVLASSAAQRTSSSNFKVCEMTERANPD